CTGCCQSLEAKVREKSRRSHVPWVRNNESAISLMKSAEYFSLFFLCLHGLHDRKLARRKNQAELQPTPVAAPGFASARPPVLLRLMLGSHPDDRLPRVCAMYALKSAADKGAVGTSRGLLLYK